MSSGKRKGGGNNQSDFKRLKAKVGKRALKPANLTDTSFKSASLHVGGQSIENINSDVHLLTGKGKSIGDLITQTGHPASSVRHSAMKGVGNLVDNQTPHLLRPYLSALIPACAKSCVDEDGDVRSAGISALSRLLPRQDESGIKPFSSLLVAYATSSLHSLDSSMRIDGARFVSLLSNSYPSLVRPFAGKLIPPFAALLADRDAKSSASEILQALVSMLRASHISCNSKRQLETSHHDQPDLTCIAGGNARNALILEHCSAKREGVDPNIFWNFDALVEEKYHALPRSSEELPLLDEASIHDLLSKLRDSVIELTDEEQRPGERPKADENDMDDKLHLMIQAISLLCRNSSLTSPVSKSNFSDDLQKLLPQLTNLLLEVFPVTEDDFKSANAADTEILNSTLCETIMDLMMSLYRADNKGKNEFGLDWMKTLSSYLRSRLEVLDINETSTPSLNAYCNLLLFDDERWNVHPDRFEMLEKLYILFIEARDIKTIRSPSGRKALLAFVEMMDNRDIIHHEAGVSSKNIFMRVCNTLPACLPLLKADFLYESNKIIDFLHQKSRDSSCQEKFLAVIREGVATLFKKEKKVKRLDATIFESYPITIKRKVFGLLVMVGSPSTETLNGLAALCAKINNSPRSQAIEQSLIDESINAIHCIRKTIAMKDYLGFLMSSIAIPKAKARTKGETPDTQSEAIDISLVRRLDQGVLPVTKALIDCGSLRALQMLQPQLQSWISSSNLEASGRFVRSRIAISILAFLTLDVTNLDHSSLDQEAFQPLLVKIPDSIFNAFREVASNEATMADRHYLLSPFVAVMESIPGLLEKVLCLIASWAENKEIQTAGHGKLLQIIQDLFQDERTRSAAVTSADICALVNRIETSLEGTALASQAARLKLQLKLIPT